MRLDISGAQESLKKKMAPVVATGRKGGGALHSLVSATLWKDLLPQARSFSGSESELSTQLDLGVD